MTAAPTGSPWAACSLSCCGGEWGVSSGQVARAEQLFLGLDWRLVQEPTAAWALGVAQSLAWDKDH